MCRNASRTSTHRAVPRRVVHRLGLASSVAVATTALLLAAVPAEFADRPDGMTVANHQWSGSGDRKPAPGRP